ncbi:hypothetical protein COCVIDRAFT_104356, partial [Bipolaris victoriae FI3]
VESRAHSTPPPLSFNCITTSPDALLVELPNTNTHAITKTASADSDAIHIPCLIPAF